LQTTQKHSEDCPSNQVSAAAMIFASDEKWRLFNCFFQPGRAKDLSAPPYVFRIFSSLYPLLSTHSVSVNITAFQFAGLFSNISICALWVAALGSLAYQ